MRTLTAALTIAPLALAACGTSSNHHDPTSCAPMATDGAPLPGAHKTTARREYVLEIGATEAMYTPDKVAAKHPKTGEAMLAGHMSPGGMSMHRLDDELDHAPRRVHPPPRTPHLRPCHRPRHPQRSPDHPHHVDVQERCTVADALLELERYPLSDAIVRSEWGFDVAPAETALASREARRSTADEFVLRRSACRGRRLRRDPR